MSAKKKNNNNNELPVDLKPTHCSVALTPLGISKWWDII